MAERPNGSIEPPDRRQETQEERAIRLDRLRNVDSIEPPYYRQETQEERATRIARGILLAQIEIAVSKLDEIKKARESFTKAVDDVNEAYFDAPQEVIELLKPEEKEAIRTVFEEAGQH